MSNQSVQVDPLNSPHPVPWGWVMATATTKASGHPTGLYYYRSQSLLSPDRQYAAYSRIQMQVQPEFFRSHVTSVLFLENLQTGDLQAITPSSPLADNPFLDSGADLDGRISIVIPVSWSQTGHCLLAREFESLFCSGIASDYAVMVDQEHNRVRTVSPLHLQYTNAVLLGWSANNLDRALFRVGNMGDEHWHLWTVDADGCTVPAPGDHPVTFGQIMSSVWMGPQVQT
ncbi:MAG TPA: hypothetical protein V6C64_12575 [Microcoleaceae cyanobacterium]